MKIKEQFRIIRDPNNPEETQAPKMPILVVLQDGTVGEASTIRGAVAIIAGNQYFDCEDALDEWNFRVEIARKETMKAIANDIYAITYSEKVGKIEENYAATPGDPDYEIDQDDPPIKIYVDTDRAFLLSLARLGAITILEREGSGLLTNWSNHTQRCGSCSYRVRRENGYICDVYNCPVEDEEGADCFSYYDNEIASGSDQGSIYINIAEEYNLDELIVKAARL